MNPNPSAEELAILAQIGIMHEALAELRIKLREVRAARASLCSNSQPAVTKDAD